MTTSNPPYSNRGVQNTKNEENPLVSMIDYLRVSFKTHNVDLILEKVLHLKKEYMEHKESGFYGYVGTYQLDNIKVLYSHGSDVRGTLIELSGQGCRQFETFLKARKVTWFDFFRDCKKNGGKFPRLDISIDDKKTYFEIPMLFDKIRNGEAISRFKKTDYNGSLSMEDGEQGGTTLYFGSKKHSEVYFCFYQKNYEQSEKYGIPLEELGDWNRYELRFKDDRANAVVSELIKSESMLPVAKGIIKNYLRFVDKDNDLNRGRWKTSHFWEVFLGDVERLKIFTKPQEDFYQKSRNWYMNQAARTRKMIKLVEDTKGISDLEDFEEELELNEKQEHMMLVYLAQPEEMIV
ncbi:putative DNA relaxase NicK [Virgibacillus pantothenticus]|nr:MULTISPECIES: replication initiation factor domain-containing protein [Virgibacillus]API91550.1 DNA relaxase NicK [Virgibacillus sp. 6R]MBS7426933.1 replication initiation factor domain-containing protein [Virgibacillus sp. 19R1-5]GIP64550.1 putative DNA relaxase NicK [Virgibacillus pantothenticus]